MTVDDAYAELGLPPGAGLKKAKAAWRGLVSRWHPDRNEQAGASARMQRINQALAAIRDASQDPVAAPPEAPEPDPVVLRTVERRVRLTLEEAAIGCIKVMSGTVVDPCEACAGTGHALEPQACEACEGQGKVRESVWFSWYGAAKPCAACEGRGVLRPMCQACEGSGKIEALRYRMSVRLPPGVRSGDTLQALPDNAAAAKVMLDIHVELLPHDVLVLDDDGSVRCELPVDGFQWIANRTIDVPTLQGPRRLGLQRGQVMYRLQGQGFPEGRNGARADQIVIVVPRFPAKLSLKQERLLDQLVATTVSVAEEAGAEKQH